MNDEAASEDYTEDNSMVTSKKSYQKNRNKNSDAARNKLKVSGEFEVFVKNQ
jgi:hypothetical protein